MSEPWGLSTKSTLEQSEEELKHIFGEKAVISRVGRFNLIHLDDPSPEQIVERVREFDPKLLFHDDCPLCEMLRKEGGNVVFDDLD